MNIGAAVNTIRTRSGAHVDVGAAGPPLLGVIHRSVHSYFLNRFLRRRRNGLADRQVNRGAALNWKGAQSGGRADTRGIHNARRRDVTRGLAVEKVSSVYAIEQE